MYRILKTGETKYESIFSEGGGNMKRVMVSTTVVLACVGLVACGGGTVGGGRSSGDASFDELFSQGEVLAIKLSDLSATDVMPASGEVTYTGVIILADDLLTLPSAEQVIGSTSLKANFGSETITGNSDNFYSFPVDAFGNPIGGGTAVDGNLEHAGSDFTFGEVIISTTGSVVIEGTLRSIDGEIYAVFAGPDADMIAGVGFDMPAGAIDVDAVLVVD